MPGFCFAERAAILGNICDIRVVPVMGLRLLGHAAAQAGCAASCDQTEGEVVGLRSTVSVE